MPSPSPEVVAPDQLAEPGRQDVVGEVADVRVAEDAPVAARGAIGASEALPASAAGGDVDRRRSRASRAIQAGDGGRAGSRGRAEVDRAQMRIQIEMTLIAMPSAPRAGASAGSIRASAVSPGRSAGGQLRRAADAQPVEQVADDDPQGRQAVDDAAPEVDRATPRRSSASGTGDLADPAAIPAAHDLGDQLLVEHEVVGVELERDRLEQARGCRRGSRCGTRTGGARRRGSRRPVRKRLLTYFQSGMPPASGSPRNAAAEHQVALCRSTIGAISVGDPRSRRTGSRGGASRRCRRPPRGPRRSRSSGCRRSPGSGWWTMTSGPAARAISTVSSLRHVVDEDDLVDAARAGCRRTSARASAPAL